MTTTTNVQQVKLNIMTQAQYNSATKNANELYMITDASITADTLTGLTASVTELNYVDGVTSAIQTQINGKANTSLSNLDTTGKAVIDGGWVSSVSVLANAVSWTGGTVSPYSLSSYLPNDGQVYEVWVYGQVQTTATSGKFCRIALNSDIQDFMSLCCDVARSNASYWADGSAIMLVGSDRYLQQYTTTSANAGGVITVVLRGYRRVGTNS